MQKKIIALAIAGLSSAAFAQSNVTVSGNIDAGYYGSSFGTATIMDTKTAAAANGSSTSSITFAGTENLGGGLTASFNLSSDINPTQHNSAAAASATGLGSTFLNSQTFLGLASTSWGSVKFGNVNQAALETAGLSNPFGTAIGGAYSGTFARLSRAGNNGYWGTSVAEGESATGASGARLVRANNSIRYDSPSWSGFGVSVQYQQKNSDASVAASANTPGMTELGLKYANGPLNLGYVNSKVKVGAVAATGNVGVTAGTVLAVDETVTHNLLAGNYTFGAATVYAGWTSSKSSVGTNADSRSLNLAGKYAFNATWSGMLNVVKVDDKLVGNADRSLTGLGVDYAMSKRTTAYGRYENGDNNKSIADGKFTRYQIGMRHTF